MNRIAAKSMPRLNGYVCLVLLNINLFYQQLTTNKRRPLIHHAIGENERINTFVEHLTNISILLSRPQVGAFCIKIIVISNPLLAVTRVNNMMSAGRKCYNKEI